MDHPVTRIANITLPASLNPLAYEISHGVMIGSAMMITTRERREYPLYKLIPHNQLGQISLHVHCLRTQASIVISEQNITDIAISCADYLTKQLQQTSDSIQVHIAVNTNNTAIVQHFPKLSDLALAITQQQLISVDDMIECIFQLDNSIVFTARSAHTHRSVLCIPIKLAQTQHHIVLIDLNNGNMLSLAQDTLETLRATAASHLHQILIQNAKGIIRLTSSPVPSNTVTPPHQHTTDYPDQDIVTVLDSIKNTLKTTDNIPLRHTTAMPTKKIRSTLIPFFANKTSDKNDCSRKSSGDKNEDSSNKKSLRSSRTYNISELEQRLIAVLRKDNDIVIKIIINKRTDIFLICRLANNRNAIRIHTPNNLTPVIHQTSIREQAASITRHVYANLTKNDITHKNCQFSLSNTPNAEQYIKNTNSI